MISTRKLTKNDIHALVAAFETHNLAKPASTFETYLSEQQAGQRIVWLAFEDDVLAGYVTLVWESKYAPFFEKGIPEIVDLNVLPPFRKRGIATHLLDLAETEAGKQSKIIGIGVGLYPDYGSAQRLYVKRGYIPDAKGVTYNYAVVPPGQHVQLDDELILWFTKNMED